MSTTVASAIRDLLHRAGVRRCYGIVGDALNPTIDVLRSDGRIEFVHVRHREFRSLAASAKAYGTREPVAICGTEGPGVTHLIDAMLDARRERVPMIVIASDVSKS